MYNYIYDDNGVYIKNLSNNAEQYGLGQYRFPHNYELRGREITVTGEEGNHVLVFLNKTEMTFDGAKCAYEAVKLDPKLFFVRCGFRFAVIDLKQGLATLILGKEYFYGRISDSDEFPLHSDAGDEMTETYLAWVFGCDRYAVHEHFESGKCRVSWAPHPDVKNDLPCKSIKIKKGIYLVDIQGGVPHFVCADILTNRVILLEDYEHMIAVGAVMGGGRTPTLVTCYGKFLDDPHEIMIPGNVIIDLDK